jgi:hypothetical protein
MHNTGLVIASLMQSEVGGASVIQRKEVVGIKKRVVIGAGAEYDAYDYSMKLDTLELDVELAGGKDGRAGTNFDSVQSTIQDAVGTKCWVRPEPSLGENARSTNRFLIAFQDPDLRTLRAAQDALRDEYGFTRYPTIGQIEIALDMKPKPGRDAETALTDAVLLLRQHFFPRIGWAQVSDRHLARIYVEGAGVHRMNLSYECRGSASIKDYPDGTFYVGQNASDMPHYKIYRKRLDGVVRKGDAITSRTAIPVSEQFVRLEVTLGPPAIAKTFGGLTVEDLLSSKLGSLRRYFQFAAPCVPSWEHRQGVSRAVGKKYSELVQTTFSEKGAWWFAANAAQTCRDKRLKGGKLVIHETLNAKARNAFRKLRYQLDRESKLLDE